MLLAFSGCDLESTTGTNNTGKWVSVTGNSIFVSTGGPLSNNPVMESRLNQRSSIILSSSATTLFVSGWVYCGSGVSSRIYFLNGSTVVSWISIVFGPNGVVELYSNSNNLIASGQNKLQTSIQTWYWFTGKIVFHDTNGSIEFYVNGIKGIDYSNINTNNSLGLPDRVCFTSNSNSTSHVKYDDLIISDNNGDNPFNTFIHSPISISTIMVNGNIGTAQWSPSTGSTNYNMVNQKPLVTTNSINSKSLNIKDEYSLEDISVSPLAIQYNLSTVNPNIFENKLEVVLDVNTNTNSTTYTISPSSVPYTLSKIFEKSTDGSSWNTSKVNSTTISVIQRE